MNNSNEVLFFPLADEREDVQKKTFTKWINAQFAKVIHVFIYLLIKISFFIFKKKTRKKPDILTLGLSSQDNSYKSQILLKAADWFIRKKCSIFISLISAVIEM